MNKKNWFEGVFGLSSDRVNENWGQKQWHPAISPPARHEDEPEQLVYAYDSQRHPGRAVTFIAVIIIAVGGAFVRWSGGNDTAAAADRPPITAPAQR